VVGVAVCVDICCCMYFTRYGDIDGYGDCDADIGIAADHDYDGVDVDGGC